MELIFDNRARRVEFDGTVSGLLRDLKVMREEVVVKVNGRLVPDTRVLGPSDKVEVIKVVFGG
ncbi:MAG: MoaD/ThiS family protein [Candidatus Micrarchaeota archaeon]